jgi:hypothetical protein
MSYAVFSNIRFISVLLTNLQTGNTELDTMNAMF